MASVLDLCKRVAERLDTIDGLRATHYVPNTIAAPAAFVHPRTVDYDQTFARGIDELTVEIHVAVAHASDRSGQELLLTLIDSTKIKDTLETEPLDGFETLVVERLDAYGVRAIAGKDYVVATFIATVMA